MAISHNDLATIDQHHDDSEWLMANLADVYTTVRAAVFRPPLLHEGIAVLFKISPFLLTVSDLKPWLDMFHHTLVEMMTLGDNAILMQIWELIANSYLQVGDPKMALRAFNNTLSRAETENAIHLILNAYIGLFKVQSYRQDDRFNGELVEKAIGLSRQTDDLALKAALYQVIAAAYEYRRETTEALGYGQMAYACWSQLGDVWHMARMAFNLVTVYRNTPRINMATVWLKQAEALYMRTDDPRQYALTTYEQSVLCRKNGETRAARQWAEMALREFEQLKPPHYQRHYIAIAHHQVALTQMELEAYDLALPHVEMALSIFQELDNPYEQVNLYNSLGYIHGKKGRIIKALWCLGEGMLLLRKLPPSTSRTEMTKLLEASMSEVDVLL